MSTRPAPGTAALPAVSTPLFARLADDAALFPPGNAPMRHALTEHAGHRRSWYAAFVGPFLCPATRVTELRAALPSDTAEPLRLGLIAAAGDLDALGRAWDEAAGDDRLALSHAEVSLGAGDPAERLRKVLDGPATDELFVELALGSGVEEALRAVAVTAAGRDVAVKFRTGGTTAQAFPAESLLAAGLRLAIDLDLSFKLTAGLHHAVRRTDPETGWEQHGFLNVLVAVRAALLGGEVPELTDLLAERDAKPLIDQVERMSEPDAMVVRSFFRSFGCCGVTDPLADLLTMGLVAGPAGSPASERAALAGSPADPTAR